MQALPIKKPRKSSQRERKISIFEFCRRNFPHLSIEMKKSGNFFMGNSVEEVGNPMRFDEIRQNSRKIVKMLQHG